LQDENSWSDLHPYIHAISDFKMWAFLMLAVLVLICYTAYESSPK